jgi:hypothetical protein
LRRRTPITRERIRVVAPEAIRSHSARLRRAVSRRREPRRGHPPFTPALWPETRIMARTFRP